MALQLNWNKCQENVWCNLLNLNLSHEHFNNLEGIYIIWHGGQNPATVRIGQGNIRDRLTAHKNDKEILAYANLTLYVTWSEVSSTNRSGVETYLANKLNPKVGERFPNEKAIEVNLPW